MARAKKKIEEKKPDQIAVENYEKEIAMLEERLEKEPFDWSMRNFYCAQLSIKRANLENLRNKISRKKENRDYKPTFFYI